MSLNKSISWGNYNIPKTIVFKDANAAIGAFLRMSQDFYLSQEFEFISKFKARNLERTVCDCLKFKVVRTTFKKCKFTFRKKVISWLL